MAKQVLRDSISAGQGSPTRWPLVAAPSVVRLLSVITTHRFGSDDFCQCPEPYRLRYTCRRHTQCRHHGRWIVMPALGGEWVTRFQF